MITNGLICYDLYLLLLTLAKVSIFSPNFLRCENNCNLKLAVAANAAIVTIFVLSATKSHAYQRNLFNKNLYIFATFLQYENNRNLKLAAAADAATVTIFVLSGRNDRDRSACPSLADALA